MAGARTAALFTIALFFCAASASAAPFVYTSQTRSVMAHTHGPAGDPSQTLSASNFALFDQTAAVVDTPGGGSASQRQRSELLSNTISVLSEFTGFRPAFAGTGVADGESISTIAFTVAGATQVELNANVGYTDTGIGNQGPHVVSLTGPGASINWQIWNYPPDPWLGPRTTTLTLTPGTYTLNVDLDSWIGGSLPQRSTSGGTVTLTQVPEPACVGLTLTPSLVACRRRRST